MIACINLRLFYSAFILLFRFILRLNLRQRPLYLCDTGGITWSAHELRSRAAFPADICQKFTATSGLYPAIVINTNPI